MKFVSNRDIIVRSLHGHAIEFIKGAPTGVPAIMHAEVMEKGILPVEDNGEPIDPEKNEVITEKPKVLMAPEDGVEFDAQILEVITEIVRRNKSTDFTGGGRPSAIAVTAGLGWRADQKDVNKVWEKHRAELINKKAA